MTDRAIIHRFRLLVRDQLTYMSDGPERKALNDARAAVLSAVEKPLVAMPEAGWRNRWCADSKKADLGKTYATPSTEDPEQLQRTRDDAEAAGLGWPGYDFTRAMDRGDIER
jgi:hypothetical protein